MNKGDLVSKIAREAGFTKTDTQELINTFIDVVVNTVKKGEKVELTGFGSFSLTERAARTGRNPQTGETMEIAAKKVPKFKPGKSFKDRVA